MDEEKEIFIAGMLLGFAIDYAIALNWTGVSLCALGINLISYRIMRGLK